MKTLSVTDLMRADVAGMEPYTPILPFEVLSAKLGFPPEQLIKLDANENPYGPSPRAVHALASFPYNHIYPDPSHTLLREALEGYVGLDRSYILCGNGSDELLDLVLRLFIEPGDAVINCPPTFGMYPFVTAVCGARLIDVPRLTDFSIDVDRIEALVRSQDDSTSRGRIKVIFICQPNNPDGGLASAADIERLLRLPLVVVVDEAYAEFSGESVVSWVPRYSNLIVMRTFSKWAGLAGLRLGYGLFPLELVDHLWKIKQPYNVNTAAQAAALASLEDLDYLRRNVQRIIDERERLLGLLRRVSYLYPYPSRSNFILCRVVNREALEVKRALERRGILIRHFDKPGISDCVRISVGRPEQNDRLIEALLTV